MEANRLAKAHNTPSPAASSTISLIVALRGSRQSQVKLRTVSCVSGGCELGINGYGIRAPE